VPPTHPRLTAAPCPASAPPGGRGLRLPRRSVSPISENQVPSSEGYVLFYELEEPPGRRP